MEILPIVAIGLVAAFIIVIIKQQRPEFAMYLSVAVGVLIFGLMLDKIVAIFTVLKDLATQAKINMVYMGTVLKIVGIAYIAEFGAQICRDAGEGAVASKIEFAAKILVMILAIPILVAILDVLLKLIP